MSRVAKNLFIAAVCIVCISGVQAQTAQTDWPMYGHDPHHSFAAVDSGITAQNARSLLRAWVFTPGDVVSASPTVVEGVVYVGSWDGFFYAFDAASGAVKWKFQVDCDNAIVPVPPQCLASGQSPPDRTTTDGGLITSSAMVSSGVVYFAGGKTVYALDLGGNLLWKRVLCGNPEESKCELDAKDPTKIFSSPMIFQDKILLGQTADGFTGYRGAIMALKITDGSTAWRFEVHTDNTGCGSVWSTGAVDEINDLVFFGTGDCQGGAPTPYDEAVLALDTDTGTLRWVFQPTSDLINGCDFDFGASANIFEIGTNRYIGIGNKNGTYYVLRGNFKFVCLIHADMTGVVHVVDPSQSLPHDQDFYDRQAQSEQARLLADASGMADRSEDAQLNDVAAGIGEIVTMTGAGSQTVSLMRFVRQTIVVRVGDTVEWTSLDPSINHTVTFGTEPADPRPPSAGVTATLDGARQVTIASPSDSVNSGFLSPAPQDRANLAQSNPGITRFRVNFTSPGTFNYICAIHDQLGMKGTVIVYP